MASQSEMNLDQLRAQAASMRQENLLPSEEASVYLGGAELQGNTEYGDIVLNTPKGLYDAPKVPLFEQFQHSTATPWDVESAIIEVGLLEAPAEFDARVENNANGRSGLKEPYIHTVGNELLYQYRELQKDGKFSEDVMIMSDEEFAKLDTDEDKANYLQQLMMVTDMRDAQMRLFLGMELINNYSPNIPAAVLDEVEYSIPFRQKEALMNHMLQQSYDDLKSEVNFIRAQQDLPMNIEGFMDVAIQDFLPVANVATKMTFLNIMMNALEVPDELRPATRNLGDTRQAIRSWIDEIGPAAAAQYMIQVRQKIEELQKDPEWQAVFRDYLVIEQFENIFTPELLSGGSPVDNIDKWAGRIETGIEVLLLGWLARGAQRNLKTAFRGAQRSQLNRTANAQGARAAQAEMSNVVQGHLAQEMGIDPGEAAMNMMARPSELADEITVQLPGVEDVLARSSVIESEILQASRKSLAEVFTNEDKARIAKSEYDKLQLGDHARVAPAMSTQEVMDDGILINAVITKNGESAYKNFDELFTDLLALDPELDKLKILRRGDDGKVKPVNIKGPLEIERVYNTRNLSQMPDEELATRLAKALDDDFEMEYTILQREAARREGSQKVGDFLDDEYFLQYNHFRAFHPLDKIAFGADTIKHTAIPLDVLAPNMKFGDDLYGAVQAATNADARINRLYNDMYKPYYKLGAKSKRRVSNVFAWAEDEAQSLGMDVTLSQIRSEFPDLTPKEIQGIISIRVGLDAQYAVLNRRIWREYNGLDFRTARPLNGDLEAYHGKVLRGEDLKPGVVYDPVRQEVRVLSKKDVESLDGAMDKVIKLPEPIDVPGTNGTSRISRIYVSSDHYRVGELAEDILPRYPGYRYRFQQDPYYIVKRQSDVMLDGSRQSFPTETAFRTAGSRLESEQYLNRTFTRTTDRSGKTVWVDRAGNEYDAIHAKSLAQTDAALKERQVLQWAGRMFFDKRNDVGLKSVNGNQAEIMDFTKALERGTSLSTRINTFEDMLRSMRQALYGTFKLPELSNVNIAHKDINTIIKDLRNGRKNVVGDTEMTKKYNQAISVAKYIRAQEGVDSPFIRHFREQVLGTAIWADRMLNNKGFKPGKLSSVEKWAQTADPFKAMRTTAFGTFMVLRPGRQLVLQMMQPLFLSGIDPAYVLSGRGFVDSIMLRTAYAQMRNANYVADGMSIAGRAKIMGLSKRELTRMVDKLERSGVVDVVDLHSFSGGTRRWQQLQPHEGTLVGAAGYGVKKAGSVIYNGLKSYGFDMGEEINKIGTYLIATRRVKKKNGYDSLLDLTDEDWRQVYKDTEHLSFAMTKASSFGYQSGPLSVPTQFLAFTHKAILTILGQNPALKGKDLARIWVGMLALYGADVAGLRQWSKEAMYEAGFDDTFMNTELPGGGTVIDLVSGGLIQSFVNAVGNVTVEDWQNLSTGTVGPTLNLTQFVEMFIDGLAKRPIGVAFGPFGNRFNAFLQSAEFVNAMATGFEGNEVDAAAKMADLSLRKLLPQYSDAMAAWHHWKHGQVVTSNGTVQLIEPSLLNIFARGTMGMRTLAEEADFRRRELEWEDDAMKRDFINANRRAVQQYINLYRTGEIDEETFMDVARLVGHLTKRAPEHMQDEILQSIWDGTLGTDETQTPAQALWDAMVEKHSFTAGEAKALMSEMPMTEAQRAQMNEWLEIYDESPKNQAEITEQYIKRNER